VLGCGAANRAVNDVYSTVSYLPTVLNCRGLNVVCVPDGSKTTDQGEVQIYGAFEFSRYGQKKNDGLNVIRRASIANDAGGWQFAAEGEIQPYEQLENYQRRKIVERLTPLMLESYCTALGIELFNSDFYGEQSLSLHIQRKTVGGLTMSIAEARSHIHISGTDCGGMTGNTDDSQSTQNQLPAAPRFL
jgi:hypothetical protein